ALEPGQISRDRFLDLRFGRARTHDELRRQPMVNDDAVTVDALRPAHVQLDHLAADLHEAHGCKVRVAADGNGRDMRAAACENRCVMRRAVATGAIVLFFLVSAPAVAKDWLSFNRAWARPGDT